jgi:hypothetical protein
MSAGGDGARVNVIDLRLEVQSDDDVRLLRGALLAARATELGEVRRRTARPSFGYGTGSQRDSMLVEAAERQRRVELLDGLLAALDQGAGA